MVRPFNWKRITGAMSASDPKRLFLPISLGVLLDELQHRVANSLQIIASIIMMKARTVVSEETRVHLHDTYKRVMSVATVQQQLHASGVGGRIEMAIYTILPMVTQYYVCNLEQRVANIGGTK